MPLLYFSSMVNSDFLKSVEHFVNLSYKHLFVYKLSSQRPLKHGLDGLLVNNSLYSMILVFDTME